MVSSFDASSIKKVIDQLVEYAKPRIDSGDFDRFSAFIGLYYSNTALEDVSDRSIEELYGAVFSHWQLLHEKKPKEIKVNVFNPKLDEQGFESKRTLIQVVTDDMPFLVDSIRMELNRLGLTTHLMIHIGGMRVFRDDQHQVVRLASYHTKDDQGSTIEAPISMEIDRQTDSKVLADLQRNIRQVLKDVRYAVQDWAVMTKRMRDMALQITSQKMFQKESELHESKAFLDWVLADHFTFLGARDYEMVGTGQNRALRLVAGSGLGVLKDETHSKMLRQYADLPREAREMALSKEQIIIVTKTNTISTVHRPAYTDCITVKRFNVDGDLIGESRFIGLYTSDVYRCDPRTIPIIREKISTIRERAGLPEKSHAGKDLMHILATLPRDDLFHASVDELYQWAIGILHLQERRRIRVFLRKDAYSRFISCLIYVPRENFTTNLVLRMQEILLRTFHGLDIGFTTYFSESILARIHFMIRIDASVSHDEDIKLLEKELIEVGVSWEDGFRDSILNYFGEEAGIPIFNRYRRAFPAGYRENFAPDQAIIDVLHIQKLSDASSLGMSFYQPAGAEKDAIRFKLYHPEATIPLSDALPMLEHMGLRVIGEQPYQITLNDQKRIWINDFSMTYAKEANFDVEAVKSIFQEAFEKVWAGEAEDDDFNRLVLEAELTWREITVLRAYASYFRQVGFMFSQGYIADTLVRHPNIARLLMTLFKYRFNPENKVANQKLLDEIEQKIYQALDAVAVLDEDRILRRYLSLINATLRTTYFQTETDGSHKSYLAFKLDSEKIPDMPLPLPKYEIFVYSPRFEGIHLRAAKVARGGIRWSDRREDYRTEILGLMKAQQVKNAVIVPAGAKGGFALKKLPVNASRDVIAKEGITCYQNFMRALLDLTDNIVNGEVVHPVKTICYDGQDPYLVVAADKGTAAFSDHANRIATEKNYWMGDAFASGGSAGYDHKKMGITARGAWISAERHFQELGIDLDQAEITVVGIGDMSGDVFGNGMLLSKHIKLVAAFNHEHIFLDPNPSPEKSYAERSRLFALPRSTWDDYDRSLISAGGGVYSRKLKSIPLTEPVQALLGIKKDALMPTELIRAILKAPVDLVWNGGIGTYVKASTETNSDVGDRTNDVLRIDGKELRARVVCEGGNLGLTQLGRIEYELSGGRINTDFIDNSAGVDCSDHEVNIKILLNGFVAAGEMTEKQRNQLLASMTDKIAKLVLEDNYHQNRAVSLAAFTSFRDLNIYQRFISTLEKAGQLNRSLEFLPDDKTLMERKAAGVGLTRPELCILLSYSKMILKDQIKHSALVEDPYISEFVNGAFPNTLSRKYEAAIKKHYLAKEIIATQLTNRLVAEMGATFAYQMQDETGVSVSALVRAYVVSMKIFELEQLLAEIDNLGSPVEALIRNQMSEEVIRLVRRGVRWLLRNRHTQLDVAATIDHFSTQMNSLSRRLPKLLLGDDKAAMDNRQQYFVDHHVPVDIALKVASTMPIYHALNIVEAATTYQEEVFRVAKIYFMLADRLNLFWFRERINVYPVDTHWGVLARASYKGDLDWIQRELTVRVLLDTKARSIPGKINEWLTKHESEIKRWHSILTEMRNADAKDFAILFVAIRELFDLSSNHAPKEVSTNDSKE